MTKSLTKLRYLLHTSIITNFIILLLVDYNFIICSTTLDYIRIHLISLHKYEHIVIESSIQNTKCIRIDNNGSWIGLIQYFQIFSHIIIPITDYKVLNADLLLLVPQLLLLLSKPLHLLILLLLHLLPLIYNKQQHILCKCNLNNLTESFYGLLISVTP